MRLKICDLVSVTKKNSTYARCVTINALPYFYTTNTPKQKSIFLIEFWIGCCIIKVVRFIMDKDIEM